METFKEIDRKQEAYIKAANEALSQMRDKGGRWWNYSVSHSTFDLAVGDALGDDNIALCIAACEYIAGPVSWPNQRIEVVWRCDRTRIHREWEFELRDETVGFKAVGLSFGWEKNFDLLKYGSLHLSRWVGKTE